MGNICSTSNITVSDYKDFCPLRVATLYADIDESINKKKKIETIVEYFMKPYHRYNLDVLCIQGIRNYKILKEIIVAFKNRIEKFNDDNRGGYKKSIYLEYYPDIDATNHDDNDVYWSTSESDNDKKNYDKLIVSRYNILQSGDVPIGTNKRVENIDNSSLMINNDSDEIMNVYKYIQFVNLNVDGTFVSIYNIELEEDSIGISNYKERKKQLRELKEFIESNRENNKSDNIRQFVYGDRAYISTNRDIHIVVGMFHINEVKNGGTSAEYNKTISLLNAVDINKWILGLRKETAYVFTNVKFTKDTFTMLISKNHSMNNTIQLKSQKLFEDHKTVIISSNINKHIVDMSQFTNFPEDSIFMLYKPNIRIVDENKPMYNKRNVSDTPRKFIDQKVQNDMSIKIEKHLETIPEEKIFGQSVSSGVKQITHKSSFGYFNNNHNESQLSISDPPASPGVRRSIPMYELMTRSAEKDIKIESGSGTHIPKLNIANTNDDDYINNLIKIAEQLKKSKQIAENLNKISVKDNESDNESDDDADKDIKNVIDMNLKKIINNKNRKKTLYTPKSDIDMDEKN
jgi:hypothetical protein